MQTLFTLLLFESISGGELILILLAVFLLFGPNKIPEIAKGLAKGLRDIKKATGDIRDEVNKTLEPLKKEIQEPLTKIKDELNSDDSKKVSEDSSSGNLEKPVITGENNTEHKSKDDFAG